MAKSDDEVEAYLASARVPEGQKPEVGRLFARSMAHELATSLAEWEATARRFERERMTQVAMVQALQAGSAYWG